jgi:alpha-glucoside transport system substrate-binding protein
MVYEGDFVRNFVPRRARTATRRTAGDARFFDFPSASPGTAALGRSAVVGGDVAVLFKAGDAGKELIRFLATPEAAAVWAREGGFLSPNRRLDRRAYSDGLGRRAAEQLAAATTVRFDLSDLQPPAFGATVEQGEWEIFQDFARDPRDVEGTTRRLEAGATAARACERAIGGQC